VSNQSQSGYTAAKGVGVGPGGHGCPSVDDFTEYVIASRQVGPAPCHTLKLEKHDADTNHKVVGVGNRQ